MKYNEIYTESIEEPEKFWTKQADAIDWYNKPKVILSKDENEDRKSGGSFIYILIAVVFLGIGYFIK